MEDKISVIVPVYNADWHIKACIESLLAQSHTNIELLVINDGSTDQSERIIEELAQQDQRIRFFSTENRGVAAARNMALEKATGEWIAFCDSDDVVPQNAYKWMLRAAHRTGAEVVVGSLKVQKTNECFFFKYCSRQDDFSLFFSGPSLCNRLFKHEAIRGLRFDSLSVGEDVVFLTRVFSVSHKITPIRQSVYTYIHREDAVQKSLTHSYSFDTFMGHLNAWRKVKSMWGCAVQERSESYLAQITVPYLYQQVLLVPTIEGKCSALSEFRLFLEEIPWEKYANTFEAVFGITYSEFKRATDIEYFDMTISKDCRERVSAQFCAGKIGFRYIVKYFSLWWKYKWR